MNQSQKKIVLIIAFSDLQIDSRIKRQIDFLSDHYHVITAGYNDPNRNDITFINIAPKLHSKLQKIVSGCRLLAAHYEAYYWQHPKIEAAFSHLKGLTVDLIIANDLDTLPLALKIAKGAKVVIDAHEYAPGEFEDNLLWKILYKKYKTYLCQTYLQQAHAMMTVSSGIAKEYKRLFDILPEVITNASPFVKATHASSELPTIKMVSHGIAHPSRNIEYMIDLFAHLDDRFSLDLYLVPYSSPYADKLKRRAKQFPSIRFLKPVPMPSIVSHLNHYDIGLFLLPPINFNYKHALPNKFFEFIQARLAIAIGPSPEMASLVKRYQCGIVATDFSPKMLAQELMTLDRSAIETFKINADIAAKDLSAETNRSTILSILDKALKSTTTLSSQG